MAISYFLEYPGTNGYYPGYSPGRAVDLTVTASTGDLIIVAVYAGTQIGDPGNNGSFTTTAGSTTAWIQASSPNPGVFAASFGVAYATATGNGTVVIQAVAATDSGGYVCATGIVIPAAEWTGTPTFTDWGPTGAGITQSATLSNQATVLMLGSTAGATALSGLTPAGGTSHLANMSELPSAITSSWTAQAAGTRSYGFTSGTVSDVFTSGSIVVVREPTTDSPVTYGRHITIGG